MKSNVFFISSLVEVAYVMFRCFTTFVVLPVASVSPFGEGGRRYVVLLLLAAGATVFSFTRWAKIAHYLGIAIGLVALGYWVNVILTAPMWTGSYFHQNVAPEVCFSLASLCQLLVGRPADLYRNS